MKHSRNTFLVSALVLALVALAATPALAATITVNQGGGADYTTINDALTTASDGDVIVIQDSATYTEDVTVAVNNLTIQADTGQTPTIASGAYSPTLDAALGGTVTTGGLVLAATGVQLTDLTIQANDSLIACTLEAGASATITGSTVSAAFYTVANVGTLVLDSTTVGGGAGTNISLYNAGAGLTLQNGSVVQAAELISNGVTISLSQTSPGPLSVSDSTINFGGDSGDKGIYATGPDGGVVGDCGDVTLTNTAMIGLPGAGRGIDVIDSCVVTLNNSSISTGGYGIHTNTIGSPSIVVENGSVLQGLAAGIEIGMLGSLEISDSQIINNPAYGIGYVGTIPAGAFATTITNTTISGNGNGLLLNDLDTNHDLYLDDASVVSNGTHGIWAAAGGTATITAVNGTQINGNVGGHGVFADASLGVLNFSASGNSEVNGNATHGIRVDAPGSSSIVLEETTVSNNAGRGIVLIGGSCAITATTATISGNGLDGIRKGPSVSSLDLTLVGCDIVSNGSHAVDMSVGGGVATVDATDCDFSNNTGFGIFGTPVTEATLIDCRAEGNGATNQNYYFGSIGAGGVTVDGGYSINSGINYNLGGTPGGPISFSNTLIQGGGAQGLIIGVANVPAVTIDNCEILANGDGVRLNLPATLDIDDSLLRWNTVGLSMGASSTATLDQTDILDGGGSGVFLEAGNHHFTLNGCSLNNNTHAFNVRPDAFSILDIRNSDLSGNRTHNMEMVGESLDLTLVNTHMDNGANWGIFTDGQYNGDGQGTLLKIDMTNSTMDGNNVDAVNPTNFDTVDIDLRDNSSISNNGRYGLYYSGSITTSTLDLSDSHIDGNVNDGVQVENPLPMTLTASGSSFDGNGNNLFLNGVGNVIDLTNCSISDSVGQGLITQQGVMTLTNCTLNDNGSFAINNWNGPSTVTLIGTNIERTDVLAGHALNMPLAISVLMQNSSVSETTGSMFLIGGASLASSIVLDNCDFTSNTGNTGTNINGYLPVGAGSTVEVTDSNFVGNDGITLWFNNASGAVDATISNTVVDGGLYGIWMANPGDYALSNVTVENVVNQALMNTVGPVTTTMDGCTVDNNGVVYADNFGGAISNVDLTVSNSSFTGNANGPGMVAGTALFDNCDFADTANVAIQMFGASPFVVQNSSFDNNGTIVNGQFDARAGDVTLSTCTFSSTDDFHYVQEPSATADLLMQGCVFDDPPVNAILSWSPAGIEMVGCTFNGSAASPGSMIALRDGVTTVTDCVFNDATTVFDYGFAVDKSTPTMVMSGCEVNNPWLFAEISNGLQDGTLPAYPSATISSTTISLIDDGSRSDAFRFATGNTSFTLVMDQVDARYQGSNPNTFFFHNESSSNLITTITRSTFLNFANAFFSNSTNTLSSMSFDQCDFVSNTGRKSAIFIDGTSATDVDVVDSVFFDTSVIENGSGEATVDFSVADENGGAGLFDANVVQGADMVNPGTAGYYTTAWGNQNYLRKSNSSDALGLNSGNGPENFAGARGSFSVPVFEGTGARHWQLY